MTTDQADPDKHPDMAQRMARKYGDADISKMRNAFNLMALPIPIDAEYFPTTDGGAMASLDYYGVRIRVIDNNKYEEIEHPNILRPLGSFLTGNLRVDILPSVIPDVNADDSIYLVRKLRQGGIDLWDDNYENSGYIPAVPGVTEKPFPVVLDMGAFKSKPELAAIDPDAPIVKRGYRDFPVADRPFNQYDDCMDTQDKVYGPLRRQFQEALESSAAGDISKMKAFWESCARAREEGRTFVAHASDRPEYDVEADGSPCTYRQPRRTTPVKLAG